MANAARQWVKRLMGAHIRRLKMADAPEPDTDEANDAALIWDEAFRDVQALDSEVDRASRVVCHRPPAWWREQLKAILDAIEEERGANLAQGQMADPHGYADRDMAAAASKTCEVCQGGGLATVYHRDFAGDPTIHVVNSDGTTSRIKGRFALACLCPLGRWILAANHRSASSPKLDSGESERMRAQARAMDGIHAVIEGRTDYTIHDPTSPPLDDHEVPRTLDWRAHLASWADRASVPDARAGRCAPR